MQITVVSKRHVRLYITRRLPYFSAPALVVELVDTLS